LSQAANTMPKQKIWSKARVDIARSLPRRRSRVNARFTA
jgi:hypothetical protein